MIELLGRRDLEAVDRDALWVDAAHHVPDRPVLARGVERLQDDKNPPGVLGRQAGLVLGEQFDALGEQLLAVFLALQTTLEGGVEVLGQANIAAGFQPKRRDEVSEALPLTVS